MPREQISMPPQEVAEFLRGERGLVLGPLAEDGGPWADAAACLFRDNTVFFSIPRSGHSFRNIQRQSRVCCILEQWPSYYEIKGVILHGEARMVADEDAEGVLAAMASLFLSDKASERVLFALGLDDVVSFDFSKIKRKY